MSASIGTKMPAFSGREVCRMLLLADEIWAMAEVRAGESRLTPAWYAGLAVPFYLVWVLAGLAARSPARSSETRKRSVSILRFPRSSSSWSWVSGRDERPARFSLRALRRGPRAPIPPGVWYIAAGAGAGVIAALFTGERQEARHDARSAHASCDRRDGRGDRADPDGGLVLIRFVTIGPKQSGRWRRFRRPY